MDVIDRDALVMMARERHAQAVRYREGWHNDRTIALADALDKHASALEALIAWADAAQEELYELKALVEQRGWRKGQAEALAALMARWPRRG